jgi:sulfite reductase (NADPH) flavoprotein alpha-component
MLEQNKWNSLQGLIQGASREELIWINGYLTGLLGQTPGEQGGAVVAAKTRRFTLAYGTETGNAKALATQYAAEAKKKGFQVKLVSLDQYRVADLDREEYLFVIVSTQGDGEPPAGALKFFEALRSSEKKLPNLKFGVLGLGDTSYPQFCQAGVELDDLFAKLGGNRTLELVKCDTDYAGTAGQWFASVLNSLSSAPVAASAGEASKPAASGKKNYRGTVVANINLNDTPSNKETHHIEIRCDDDIAYEPGDAAGFIPHHSKEQVERVLRALGVDGKGEFTFRGETAVLSDLLTRRVSLTSLPLRVLKKYGELVSKQIEEDRLDLAPLLEKYPLRSSTSVQKLLDILDPIAPRLYSIASSPGAHPGELHLTVARNTYEVNGEVRLGLCSQFLNTLTEGSVVDFYIHPNQRFRLPADDRDVIMIGPGTGIAPFRSFLAERDSRGASGRNWLFFGEQHFVTDFLYQTELQNFLSLGVLTRLDLAFSRDQKEKIYVQHRLRENGAQVFEWLQHGASLYVCGTKDPMSYDVEKALLEIVREHGKLSEEEAVHYLERLSNDNRYLKDVY